MRYCPQHYEMSKNMEFYRFEQQPKNKVGLSVHVYKDKFLHLHKYAPQMEGEVLMRKFIEGLNKDLYYQVKGARTKDFLDAIAKAENYEKKGCYEANNGTQGRMISTSQRPQGRTFNAAPQNGPNSGPS